MALKRGKEFVMITLIDDLHQRETQPEELIALDEALNRLETMNERHAKIIEYSFFVGLNHEEIAEVLLVSVPTVRRDWRIARAWLSRELKKSID
jgi:RNA polymerase sigma factor (sigma-70 family)